MAGESEEKGAQGAGGEISTGGFVATQGEGVVNYFFPVTVEVRTITADVDADALVDRALGRLADGLDSE